MKLKHRDRTFLFTTTFLFVIIMIIYLVNDAMIYKTYYVTEFNRIEKIIDEFIDNMRNSTLEEVKEKSKVLLNDPSIDKVYVNDMDRYSIDNIKIDGDGTELSIIRKPINIRSGRYIIEVLGRFHVQKDLKENLNALIPKTIFLMLLFSAVFSYIYSKYITGPILYISKKTSEMKELDKDITIEVNSDDEIAMLSKDINELNKTLRKNINELNNMKEYKKQLMLGLSHEIKTPIAAMNGILEGMLDEVYPYTDRDKYIRECRRLSAKLGKIANEMLDITKLEAIPAVMENIPLKDCVEAIIDSYKIILLEKNISYNIFIAEDYKVNADRRLFEKAILNVIENAIKYGDKNSGVIIKLDEDVLSIKNYGQNLSEEDISLIFNPLYRVKNISDDVEGKGIGLFIVRECLNALKFHHYISNFEDGIIFTIVLGGK
ncbi:MAG: HAMP domain-containing sensor histidine kinase [Clostridium sp.]|uniref:HAMP domain-containing sensor histidine kinase n=1 Tax=Clostridium sp. TaxID=1506 RepID=UPI002FC8D0BD